ncbi:urease accessory protein UreD [Flexibacterium corallicola]|uniref:urease accessory protein UreD n=1 Tax=Flexibacterium corallicola TaxID=3037259 RepID=UPI00286FA16B|nr:urease accessory protein UreD [Pseudovibrio sp. M1P-2-3]
MQRTYGNGRASFKWDERSGISRLDGLYQEGAAKIRFPRVYGERAEAVLINTSGGITGGDALHWQLEAGDNTCVDVTTQACEKLYKSNGGVATVSTVLKVGEGADLHWLPQETIAYNNSALKRELSVYMHPSARFLAVEAFLLGRQAMGETVEQGSLKDRWRIFKGERLIHGEDLDLGGAIYESSGKAAVLDGARAFASVLYVGPEDDEQMETLLSSIKPKAPDLSFGVSVFNGKTTARLAAADGISLRRSLVPFLQAMRGGTPLPKLWNS